MKNTLILAASLATLALGGCGKKDETPTVATDGAPDVAATDPMAGATATPAASPAQAFVDAAATSDMFEIETSKLAATKAGDAKVKTFAEQMIKAHTESTAKLKTAASAASPAISPMPSMTDIQQRTLADLQGKSGAEFDKAYAAAQVDAHQMALDALKAYAASGEVPSLKSFAGELGPIVTAHLNMAKAL
ncbi:DUF4142 domain-containing protein [Novosphingobium sp. JCM 18896]|uniref:DUF4142 domain-containing protein n=1 Tax=Novosphingobium sp. JCM 18896 TaxID=2989731 RepID=UPI002222F322|nr:DUF4142 domain-containing protein [Novosphingobium sp. JCM 18896]MCW1432192.1 DUF4142 domain-containing protein [Novosphingobium sp. JCM 18896]